MRPEVVLESMFQPLDIAASPRSFDWIQSQCKLRLYFLERFSTQWIFDWIQGSDLSLQCGSVKLRRLIWSSTGVRYRTPGVVRVVQSPCNKGSIRVNQHHLQESVNEIIVVIIIIIITIILIWKLFLYVIKSLTCCLYLWYCGKNPAVVRPLNDTFPTIFTCIWRGGIQVGKGMNRPV